MAEPTVTTDPKAATFVAIIVSILATLSGLGAASYIWGMLTLGGG